jgi:alpha/beta hydrolase fold
MAGSPGTTKVAWLSPGQVGANSVASTNACLTRSGPLPTGDPLCSNVPATSQMSVCGLPPPSRGEEVRTARSATDHEPTFPATPGAVSPHRLRTGRHTIIRWSSREILHSLARSIGRPATPRSPPCRAERPPPDLAVRWRSGRPTASPSTRRNGGGHRGPAIVFIHGFMQSHLSWMRQTASPLADGFRLVTYDVRGHGGSDKPAHPV